MSNFDYSKYPAKKTFYKGREFKSNLEAKCAESFDNLGLTWLYEEKAFRDKAFAGGQYTPDFYLPEADLYVEAAGVWDERHVQNYKVFSKMVDIPNPEDPSIAERLRIICVDGEGYFITPYGFGHRILTRCRSCGKYFGKDMEGWWGCPICKFYDGDGSVDFNRNLFEMAHLGGE